MMKSASIAAALALVLVAVAGSGGSAALASGGAGESRPCAPLSFDLRAGTLNGAGPTTALRKVKRRFPCFTGESREGAVANHGGGVFFINHDVFFYTYARYIELRAGFSGTSLPRVFGRSRAELGDALPFIPAGAGRPYWGGASDEFLDSRAGCIQMVFDGDRLMLLRSFSVSCDSVRRPED